MPHSVHGVHGAHGACDAAVDYNRDQNSRQWAAAAIVGGTLGSPRTAAANAVEADECHQCRSSPELRL